MSTEGHSEAEKSLVVRAIWFVFVGWWATGLWLSIAWFLNLTVVGIPIGIKMINMVPKVLTLKARELVQQDGATGDQTYGLGVRAVYFVFVGWWASGIWTSIAYVFTLSVIGLPVAIMMYNKLPLVVSLYDY